MSEDKKPFKVSDRRHFTPEGEARATVETEAAASETPPTSWAPPGAAAPISFAAFLLSLGAQASFLMGEGEGPKGGPDVEGAREIISILEMLKDKTEGRRTRDEDQVLEGLLYELRMAYVEKTRAGRP